MRLDAATAHLTFGIGVVVAFVETQMRGPSRPTRRMQRNRIERGAGHPFVVLVGPSDRDGERDSSPVGQDVALGAELATIGRVGTGEVPPLGAFTEALSSEAQSQAMPRFSS